MAVISATAKSSNVGARITALATQVNPVTYAPLMPIDWDTYATVAKRAVFESSGSSGPPLDIYYRFGGDAVGQLWPRLKTELTEVDMAYMFRGVAVPQAVPGSATHTPLTINLSAGDSTSFGGSGTTEITYTGPSVSLLLSGQARWDVNGTGARRIALWQNGSEVVFERANPDATSSYTQSVTWPVVANDGDRFSLVVLQNSGGPINVTAGGLRGVVVGEWQ